MNSSPAQPAAPASEPRRTGRFAKASFVLGVGLMLLLGNLPSPYVIRQPGPSFNALGTAQIRDSEGEEREVEVIRIEGAESHQANGALNVMTVNLVGSPASRPTIVQSLMAWFDPSRDVLPIEAYFAPGQTREERMEESSQLMDHSESTAIAAALRHLGHEVGAELVVEEVPADSPSAGLIEVGDVLLAYGDQPVTDVASIRAITLPTEPIGIRLRRGGEELVVQVTPRLTATADGERPLLGISVRERLTTPFEIDVELGDVGGPSAGMMFALAIIDKLEPGDLTGGRIVAGSGSITGDGDVGPIGGVRQKLYAAAELGADYFLADEGNCREALDGGVPGGIPVYAIADLDEAVEVVRANARGDAVGLRTCADAVMAGVPQV